MDAKGYHPNPLGGSRQQPIQRQNSQSFRSQPNNAIPFEVRKKIQMLLLLRHTTIGCLVSSIQDEYKVCYGQDIFPEMYGFNSWLDMLRAMWDDVSIETLKRHHVVFGNRLTHSLTIDYLERVFKGSSSTPLTPVNSVPLYSQNNSIVDCSIDNGNQSGSGSQILENSQTSENQIPSGNLHNHSHNSSTATEVVDYNSGSNSDLAVTGNEESQAQVDYVFSNQTPKPIDRTRKSSLLQNGQTQQGSSSQAMATSSEALLFSSHSQFQSTPHRTISCARSSSGIPVIDLSDDMDINFDFSTVPVDQDIKNVVTSLIPATSQSFTSFAPDIDANVATIVPESVSTDADNDIQMQVDVDIMSDFNFMSDSLNTEEQQPQQMIDEKSADAPTISIATNKFSSGDSIHIDVNPDVNDLWQNNLPPPQNTQSHIPTQFHPSPPVYDAVVVDRTSDLSSPNSPGEIRVMGQANPRRNENVPEDFFSPALAKTKRHRIVLASSSSDNSSTSDDDNNELPPKRRGYGCGGAGRGTIRGAGSSSDRGGTGGRVGGAGVVHTSIYRPRDLDPTKEESTNCRPVTRASAARGKPKSGNRRYKVSQRREDVFSGEDICFVVPSESSTDSDSEYEVPNSAKRKARKSSPPLDRNKRHRKYY